MARLAFTVGGAVAGGAFGGPMGASLGAAAGGMIGSMLFPPDDIVQEGARVNNQATTASAYGIMRPWGYGVYQVSGNIIDGSDRRIIKHKDKQSAGGKGGQQKVVTTWETAERDLAVGLGEGPISGVLRIYANEELIWDQTPGSTVRSPEWLDIQIYLGDETQLPDPTLESIYGVGQVPAYRGEAYIMFRNFQLEMFNNSEPSFRFIVVRNGTSGTNEVILDPGLGFTAGNLVHDRNTGLMHFLTGKNQEAGTVPDQLGVIYEADTQQIVGVYTWPEDITQLDEAPGAHLLSIPTLIEGEPVSLGANSHFVVHTEDADGFAQFSVYDSSGTFIGNVAPNVQKADNTDSVVADETLGILYRQASDGLKSLLKVFSIVIANNTPQITSTLGVEIPIANRDGNSQWTWYSTPSFPEGTDRAGTLLFYATDEVDNKEYVCLITPDQRNWIRRYAEITDFGGSIVSKIVWDSIQELFWVIGQSNTGASWTRFKAFDISLSVVHNVDINLSVYTDDNYITYDAVTRAIWCFKSGNLYEFNTIDLAIANTYTGWSTDSNPADNNMAYHPSTRTVWRKGDERIFLLQLDRLSSNVTYLDEVLDDLCDRAGMPSAQYRTTDTAAITVESYAIDTGGSYRSKIIPLLQAYLVYGVDKEDYIDFIPYSTNIVDLIPERDLGASTSEELLPLVGVDRSYEDELPYKVEVTYYNKETEYEQGSQAATRKANVNLKGKQSFVFPLVLTDDEAAALADVRLHMAHVARLRYQLNLMPKWRWLSGADIIQFVDDNGIKHTARILRKEFADGVVKLEAERFDPSVLTSFLSGGAAVGRTTVVENTPLVLAYYLDSPLLRERDDDASHYMAATAYSSSWRGGSIYKSTDGTTWSLSRSVFTRSAVGRVIEAMPAPSDHHLWDTNTSVTVEMVSGELETAPASTVAKGANLVLIGQHGRWEAAHFSNKTLISGKKYSVNTWLRGRLGTDHAMASHQAGDIFILVSEDDLHIIPDVFANLSQERIYRAVSFGADLYGYHTRDTRFINTGVRLKPLSPAPIILTKDPRSLDVSVDWNERTRFPMPNVWTGLTSESSIAFSIDIKDSAGSIVATHATAVSDFVYNRSAQTSDGFAALVQDTCSFEIFQVSDRVGRGYAGTVSGFTIGPPITGFEKYAINNLGADAYFRLDEASISTGNSMLEVVTSSTDSIWTGSGTSSAQVTALLSALHPGVGVRMDGQKGFNPVLSEWSAVKSATVAFMFQQEEAQATRTDLAVILDIAPEGTAFAMNITSAQVFTVYSASAGVGGTYASATTSIALNTPHMLVGSIGANGIKAYVDGQLEDTNTGLTSIASGVKDLYYGYRVGKSFPITQCTTQAFAFWRRQLTDAEVSTLNTKRGVN